MAKLSSYRRLYDTDFPKENQALVSQLAVTINQSFESIYAALNNGLTLQDNFVGGLNTLSVTTNSKPISGYLVTGTPVAGGAATQVLVNGSYGFTTTPVYPIPSSITTLDGIIVVSVSNLTNPTAYPVGGLTVSYTKSGTNIIVNGITGLDKNTNYSITVLTFGH